MNRFVIYMSLIHHNKAVDEAIKKPEEISYYNLTKGAVDALDENLANFHIGHWLGDGLSEFPSRFLTQVQLTLLLYIIHTRIIFMLPGLNS